MHQEVSEEKEVKEMVKNYSQKEAENFALFNYITDLNGQVEALQEELTSVRKEIKELTEEEVSLTRDHEETMRNLEVLVIYFIYFCSLAGGSGGSDSPENSKVLNRVNPWTFFA